MNKEENYNIYYNALLQLTINNGYELSIKLNNDGEKFSLLNKIERDEVERKLILHFKVIENIFT